MEGLQSSTSDEDFRPAGLGEEEWQAAERHTRKHVATTVMGDAPAPLPSVPVPQRGWDERPMQAAAQDVWPDSNLFPAPLIQGLELHSVVAPTRQVAPEVSASSPCVLGDGFSCDLEVKEGAAHP